MLQCVLVTPERTVHEEAADFVVLPLYDGEIGIAPGRAPMIGRLGCGEMRIYGEHGLTRYYLDTGFVEVLGNTVWVLTQQAIAAEQIDPAVVEEQLRSVLRRPARSPEEFAARQRLSERYRAQLRVARRAEAADPRGSARRG